MYAVSGCPSYFRYSYRILLSEKGQERQNCINGEAFNYEDGVWQIVRIGKRKARQRRADSVKYFIIRILFYISRKDKKSFVKADGML